MAAADYYNLHPPGAIAGSPRPTHQIPPTAPTDFRPGPTPHQAYTNSGHLSQNTPPPSYATQGLQPYDQKPQAPTSDPNRYRSNSHPPESFRPRVSFSHPQSNINTPPQYTPQSQDPRGQQFFPSQHGPPQYNPHPYPQQASNYPPPPPMQQYSQPYGANAPAMSRLSLNTPHGGYSSDPESHRHHHHHSRRRQRSPPQREKHDSTQDSLIGAAGGGLIGDLIFPGLGTVGGALAGWLGASNYGKHKERQEEMRKKEQRDWERKWSKGSYEREKPRF